MFGSEIRKLLIQVISSWQVISATVVLVIYIFIVKHVARINKRGTRNSNMPLIPKGKKKKPEKQVHSETDDLILDEETK
jgi:hypothetical protein